ncbi:MAG: DUF4160 domain-containing protein [Saprospiraceae bacterium]
MPTILWILGWRVFFYSNEGNEPLHVHAQKGDMECKFWLAPETFEIVEAFSYNLNPASRREIRKIIFEHFDYIISEWNSYFKK